MPDAQYHIKMVCTVQPSLNVRGVAKSVGDFIYLFILSVLSYIIIKLLSSFVLACPVYSVRVIYD